LSAPESPRGGLLTKKTIGFAILLGIPALVAAVATNGPIGILYVVVGGVIVTALVVRRRAFAQLARGSGGTDDQD
jgi:hypothetical protein